MANLIHQKRKSGVLKKIPLPCVSDYYNIDITAGCLFGCLYCYAQGYSSNPKNETMIFYENTLQKLRSELPRKRQRPQIVYFSPSCEPFAPFGPALEELYQVFKFLPLNKIKIFISTKGLIPARFIQLFSEHPELVNVQIGITTMDEGIRKVFEPHAVPIRYRLGNIERLCSIPAWLEARLDPLLPGITDQEDSLAKLFKALADSGIKSAIASYLFLRNSNRNRLRQAYAQFHLDLDSFYRGNRIKYSRGGAVEIAPKEYRLTKYQSLMEIAKTKGIKIKLCHCRNPDLTNEFCHPQMEHPRIARQMTLFQF